MGQCSSERSSEIDRPLAVKRGYIFLEDKMRQRGTDAVYQRGDGRWCIAVDLGGKPRRRKVFYGFTPEEAIQKREAWAPSARPLTLEERFWANVKRGNSDECWEWQRSTSDGYGHMTYEKRYIIAHRAAYEFTYGAIPDGLFVLHRCDNRRCCNPDHLWLGTNRDNVLDSVSKGRWRR